MLISVVILTKNEEENLERCLESVKWVDEIVIVDDYSKDKTVEIAQKFGTKVYFRSLDGNFSNQRNYGLDKATGEWILFVDADEEVTETLKNEISKKIKNHKFEAFRLKRSDFFCGKWLKYGETGAVKLIRLAKKGIGKWEGLVDEKWNVKGRIGTLNSPLLHYSHPNLSQFLVSINERSTLNAKGFYNKRKRLNIIEWLKPFFKFILNYFLRLGWLDGTHGFVFSVLMSFHSFLVRGKLYLIWRKGAEWK